MSILIIYTPFVKYLTSKDECHIPANINRSLKLNTHCVRTQSLDLSQERGGNVLKNISSRLPNEKINISLHRQKVIRI